MKPRDKNDRGAALLAALVIIAALAILANGIIRRQSNVWRTHRKYIKREAAMDAARSGAELALARIRLNLPVRDPIEGEIGRTVFNVRFVEDEIISEGQWKDESDIPVARIRVRYEKKRKDLRIVSWREE